MKGWRRCGYLCHSRRLCILTYFNPRSREGSDSRYNLRHPVPRHFNPRSREGSDPCGGIPVYIVAISIHAPVKRATCRDYSANVHNTISIHAPAKGATSEADEAVKLSHISIHAPAKGATPLQTRQGQPAPNFNPRSREGSDNSSSHSCRQIKNFNPRSREGSDGD